ncbi:MAG: DUF4097 domain-containing protein [Lachnospiraceae bacterium]|nr:DUF4097 domain-containing protein [Lachnospiraceae bacterium]
MKIVKALVTAILLIVVGSLLCGLSFTAMGFDISKMNLVHYEKKNYAVEEDFDSIRIRVSGENVEILPSEDGTCGVYCFEGGDYSHRVSVEDGTLVVDCDDDREWYEYISFNDDDRLLSVRLPKTEYERLGIDSDTRTVRIPAGFTFDDIRIETKAGAVYCNASEADTVSIRNYFGEIVVSGLTAEKLSLESEGGRILLEDASCSEGAEIAITDGEVKAENVKCGTFSCSGDDVDMDLNRVLVSGEMRLSAEDGSIRFRSCDAGEAYLELEAGVINGSFLTEKVFETEKVFGKISVPDSDKGGKCHIVTTGADVNITIEK